MSSPVLNSDGWNPALPIHVQLRDHDGDIKMQPSELELSRETAKVVDSIFQLDLNIDKLFGNIGSTTQVQHQHQYLNAPTANVQHTAPCAPVFPPGLNSWHASQSGHDGTGHCLPVPQPRELNIHVVNNASAPAPFSSHIVDVEMSDAFSPPAVTNKFSRRKKFNAPRPYPKSRGSRVRFVAVLDTGPILPAPYNIGQPVPIVYVESAVEASPFAAIISTSKLTRLVGSGACSYSSSRPGSRSQRVGRTHERARHC